MRRTLAAAALALTVALSTSACGNDDDANALPEAGASSPSASPSATATPSWSATAKPQRPQDEQSPEGAVAFTQFAADTVLYMMATGDAPALAEISDLSTCTSCKLWSDNHDDGKIVKLMIGTGAPTYTTVGKPTVTDDVFYNVKLAMDIPAGKSVRRDNEKKAEKVKAVKDLPFAADLQWKDDKWLLMRFDMG